MIVVEVTQEQMESAGPVFQDLLPKRVDPGARVEDEQFVVIRVDLQGETGGLSSIAHGIWAGNRK